ncbi:MAG TPA: hypothetical protein VHT27_07680 [Solirubrobacteraceae bacterium]|nr:hypothetical protein [Solirubrobacteraceae bacterium]
MTPPPDSNSSANSKGEGAGVLSQLPRTRPQRASARRAAARGTAATPAQAAAAPAKAKPAKPAAKIAGKAAKTPGKAAKKPVKAKRATTTASRPRKPAAKASKPSPARGASAPRSRSRVRASEREAVPPQGYAAEGERLSGPVQPPGGTELIATAAEIVGELAKAGVSTGERLLRDFTSLITRS